MILRHRRLLSLSLCTILTVFLAQALPHAVKPVLFFVALGTSVCLFAFSRRYRPLLVHAIALLLAAFAFFSSAAISEKREAITPYDGETFTLSATITGTSRNTGETTEAFGTAYIPTEEEAVRVAVKITAPIAAETGDILYGKATLWVADADSSLASDGYYGTLRFEENVRITGEKINLTILLGKLRTSLCERMESALPGEAGAFFSALLLGEKEGVSSEISRDMTRIGTIHILSLSGLHLAVLTVGFAFLLRRLRVSYKLRFLFISLFAVFFTLLTGLSSSLMRAGFMFILSALPIFLREERDSLSSLFGAVAIICLAAPYAVGDVGLWLSALSTLGILLLWDRDRRKERRGEDGILRILARWVKKSLAVTLAAMAATLPLTLVLFGTLPLLSPLANLVLAPLTQLALYAAVLIALFGAFAPFTFISRLICNAIFAIARFLSDIPNTVIGIERDLFFYLAIVLSLVALLYFAFIPRKRFRMRVPISLLLVCLLALTIPAAVRRIAASNSLVLSAYTDKTGYRDCLYLNDGGTHVMIPLSDQSGMGTAEARAFTAASGEIDILLLPYYTPNSSAYIRRVITSQKIRTIYLPLPRTEAEGEQLQIILAAAEAENIKTETFSSLPVQFDDATISRLEIRTEGKSIRSLIEISFADKRIVYLTDGSLASSPPSNIILLAEGSEITLNGK